MSSMVIRATSKRHFAHLVLLSRPQPYRRSSQRRALRIRRLALMVILLSACDVGMLLIRTGSAGWSLANHPTSSHLGAELGDSVALGQDRAGVNTQAIAQRTRVAIDGWLTLARSVRSAHAATALVRAIAPAPHSIINRSVR